MKKSKKSLAEIYEEDYLKEEMGYDKSVEELSGEKQLLQGLFNVLSHKLDALSNYFYTPKPIKDEIGVKSKVASIEIEEVMPITMSEASTLTPNHIYEKPSLPIKSPSEFTQQDRKKSRRLKKKISHNKNLEKQQKEKQKEKYQQQHPVGDRVVSSKKLSSSDVSSILSKKNVQLGENKDERDYTKSTNFFKKIQEVSQSKSSTSPTPKKREKKHIQSSVSVKL